MNHLLVSFLVFLFPLFVHAQAGVLENPLKAKSIEALLAVFVSGVIQIGAIALLLALIWAGFQFVSAQGNQEKLQGARSTLVWTVVGGLILLGAEVIKNSILATVESL